MTGDDFLYALSAWGIVSWEGFREACIDIFGDESEPAYLRRTLTRLGHIDCFFRSGRSIQVAPPMLATINSRNPDQVKAVLCGRRDHELVSQLSQYGSGVGIDVKILKEDNCPSVIEVSAESEATLTELVSRHGLIWAGKSCELLSEVLPSVVLKENERRTTEEISSLDISWLDLQEMQFCGVRDTEVSACCVTSGKEKGKCFLVMPDGAWPMQRHELVHLVATINGRKLTRYEPRSQLYSVLGRAPLPQLHERTVVLCSGREPKFFSRYLHYSNVSRQVAEAVSESLGHFVGESRYERSH